MSDDTTDRTVTRPSVEQEVVDRVDEQVNPHVRIPSDRLTFAERVGVLLDEYENRGEQIEELNERIEALEDKIDEKDEMVETLREQLADERNKSILGK